MFNQNIGADMLEQSVQLQIRLLLSANSTDPDLGLHYLPLKLKPFMPGVPLKGHWQIK